MECKDASEDIEEGNEIQVDFDKGIIKNITKGKSYTARPFPDFMIELIKSGGLINYIVKGVKLC